MDKRVIVTNNDLLEAGYGSGKKLLCPYCGRLGINVCIHNKDKPMTLENNNMNCIGCGNKVELICVGAI